VTIGEFVAFTIGWNSVLEYIVGTATVARGFSNYMDTLFNHTISGAFQEIVTVDVGFFSKYLDFLAFGLVVTVTVLLVLGVNASTLVNNIFTSIDLTNILIVVGAGATVAIPAYWSIKKEEIPEELQASAGKGGFMPFGFTGVMVGAAKCFYGFIGFDCIATAGEEAKNPKRNVPLAMMISLSVILCAYLSVSVILTMIDPYYELHKKAPFFYGFKQYGVKYAVVKWIVSIAAFFSLSTSILGAMVRIFGDF
jgi:solute carrier family 7 (cationic amino acid transporter), member 3